MSADDKRSGGKRPAGGKPMKSRGFKDRPGGGPKRPRNDAGGDAPSRDSRGYKSAPRSTVPAGGKPGGPRKERDRPPRVEPRPDPAPAEIPETARPEERIAKRLARAGVASRRQAEGLIADGRISVNGKVLTSPAVNVTAEDRIEIDGKPIPQVERTRLWLYHKPAGLVTSNRDPEGRPTVFERLPGDLPRVVSIGRLDINTEGLLLLTNDGGLARTLELPQTGWLRRYRVRAHGRITQKRLDDLKEGMAVDGVFYGAIEATLEREQGSNVWIEMGLREGKNREVKNVLGALGLEVNRLIRISYGPFQLGALEEGAVLEVKGKTLRDQLGARLIEEFGADFDAPVLRSFPNRPVRAGDGEGETRTMTVRKDGDWVSGTRDANKPDKGGAASGGKRFEKAGDRRERVRDRWSTKAPGTDKDEGGKPKHRANRSSNVWMAPGARPESKRKPSKGGPKPAGPRKPGKPDKG
ncbi:pseudouridine synthase [Oceaniradius stylonematis]|uniref:pseudouridine synthase n=1 Tax=Oceaniradius stylonematis TaxID=2184161 RepID=UPI0035D0E291